jgi:hypothetical protein
LVLLNFRTGNCSIGTKHTTVSLFGPDQLVTMGTFIKKLAGISRHEFSLLNSAVGAGYNGLIDNFHFTECIFEFPGFMKT